MKSGFVVAIDGPAGSGKSTIAKLLAKRLGFVHINTGALYRGVALLAQEKKANVKSEAEVLRAASGVSFEFRALPEGNLLHLDGRNVEAMIRTEEISRSASLVSLYPGVRALLLELQRSLGRLGEVVLEGRDIGTVVFPEAQVKVFLTASLEERARRRSLELKSKGSEVDEIVVRDEIARRDRQDSTREVAPLRQAPDAILVDTSGSSIEKVLDQLESIVSNAKRHEPHSHCPNG